MQTALKVVHGQFADGPAVLTDNLPEKQQIQTVVQKGIYRLGEICRLNDNSEQDGQLEGQRPSPSSSQKH